MRVSALSPSVLIHQADLFRRQAAGAIHALAWLHASFLVVTRTRYTSSSVEPHRNNRDNGITNAQ